MPGQVSGSILPVGVVTFRIDGNNDIPSNGAEHKITIFEQEYPCQLEYIAIPQLAPFAKAPHSSR